MSDFELLAKLQHHGVATRLVDFSKSALVALFFCTEDAQYGNRHDLLFGINSDVISGHENDFDFNLTYEDYTQPRKKFDNVQAIAPRLKVSCNHYLSECFDITRSTMFPDFHGFCEINSTKWSAYQHDRW